MKNKIKDYENKLRPCPFCGRKIKIVSSDDMFPSYDFVCTMDGCMLDKGFGLEMGEKSLRVYVARFNYKPVKR